ncbi:hypothetical protein L7F22_049070 [Adiantum nelumboides]|nr:hypothetical protein [Adiantum nelumboides]
MSSFHSRNPALQLSKKRKVVSFHSSNVLEPSKKRRSPPAPSSSSTELTLLPGLPNDLALLCLARVPSLALLWRVSAPWQAMVSYSTYFHSLRSSLGFKRQQWLYVLLHNPSTEDCFCTQPSHSDMCLSPTFSWHAYDPISNSWHSLPPLPRPVDFHVFSPSFIGFLHPVQCASSATKLLMVAGSRPADKRGRIETKRQSLVPALDCPLVFDTQTQEWSEGAPFDVPRKWCVCGMTTDKLLVASGCGKEWDSTLSKSAQIYDVNARRWVEIECLRSSSFSHSGVSAVEYNRKLHVVSGVGAIFNPATGKWEDMPRGMKDGWSGQSVVVDGRLYALEESTGRLKVYEEGKDEWRCIAMENEMFKHMEQLAGMEAGMFCGIVRARTSLGLEAEPVQREDVVRIVDIRGGKTMAADLRPPVGKIVTLQVLAGIV